VNPSNPAGSFVDFAMPSPGQPQAITTGSDGNLWTPEYYGNAIARITPSGVVTEFSTGMSPSSSPEGIAAGPDSNVWFTEAGGSRIGRITPAGAITEFATNLTPNSVPHDIVRGRDGNLWFTEYAGNQIGRITPAGAISEFSVPTPSSSPDGITVGPDGALWFTEYTGNKIGRMTTTGAVTDFAVPSGASHPENIVAGPDGALWFTESAAGRVGRVTTGGQVTEFVVPTPSSIPDGMTLGPDGNVWFTEFRGSANNVGRITPGATNVIVLPAGALPHTASATQGSTVTWMFEGASTSQSVTDTSGMGLFSSGVRVPVSYYTFRFVAAGTYAYEEAASSATASIRVPLKVSPAFGSTATVFTVTWSAIAAPSGYAFDVEIKRPGTSAYVQWKNGTSARSASFTADAGAGTYSFKARLRKLANGAASGYSPVKTIKVS
jgi:virginiamycin B lyase